MLVYFIPRNFSEYGKVMGRFEGRHVLQASILCIPLTFLIAAIPFLPLQVKAGVWGVLSGFPAMVILSGELDKLLYMMRYSKAAKVYYRRQARRS